MQTNSYPNSDWLTHQHRDTLASIVGHPTLTSYLAIADGEAIGRVKFEMTEVRPLLSKMAPNSLLDLAYVATLRPSATER
jgi:hypothetical protein